MTETTTAVELHTGQSTMSIREDQRYWSDSQKRALVTAAGIRDAKGNPPPDEDLMVFFHLCKARNLDPFNREIYLIERTQNGKKVWSPQTAIGGFWKTAHSVAPGEVEAGQIEWANSDGVWRDVWLEDGNPTAARVIVYRAGAAFPATCLFREFAATFADGNLMGQWKSKPAHMIGKCAEAAALRKAFPAELGGLYTDDEMQQADGTPAPRRMVGRRSAPSINAQQLAARSTVVTVAPVDDFTPPDEPAADPVDEPVQDWADQPPSGPDPWTDESAVRQPPAGVES